MRLSEEQRLELLKNVVDTAPLPIGVYLGQDLKIELANAAMIATYGKGKQVIGKSYTELLPELENQEIFNQARSVLHTGIPFHAKNKRVDIVIDDVLKPHYFNYSFTPITNADGTVIGVMNTGVDITDLYEARLEVQETQDKLRMAIDTADLGTYEIDLTSHKISTSGKFNEIWSVEGLESNEEILKKIHPEDLMVRQKAHEEAGRTGKMSYEVRLMQRGEVSKWLKINGLILKNENGIPTTLTGIVQDVSLHRRSEEALQELVNERTTALHRSNEDLFQFAHVVSHDLKEPVRKVSFFSNLLERDLGPVLQEKNSAYLKKIQQSANRMTDIIDGVLHYSTMNVSGHSVEKVDMEELFENIKTDLELMIHEKQAILIKEEIPPIEGAPILIHQLFFNLVNNALKFSKAGEPPRIVVSCSRVVRNGRDCLKISIKDNGIGLDNAFRDKIFNAFERLHSKDQYEGTGLGLALCRRIAQRHRGSIEVTGEKNVGTEFTVYLPVKQETQTI